MEEERHRTIDRDHGETRKQSVRIKEARGITKVAWLFRKNIIALLGASRMSKEFFYRNQKKHMTVQVSCPDHRWQPTYDLFAKDGMWVGIGCWKHFNDLAVILPEDQKFPGYQSTIQYCKCEKCGGLHTKNK